MGVWHAHISTTWHTIAALLYFTLLCRAAYLCSIRANLRLAHVCAIQHYILTDSSVCLCHRRATCICFSLRAPTTRSRRHVQPPPTRRQWWPRCCHLYYVDLSMINGIGSCCKEAYIPYELVGMCICDILQRSVVVAAKNLQPSYWPLQPTWKGITWVLIYTQTHTHTYKLFRNVLEANTFIRTRTCFSSFYTNFHLAGCMRGYFGGTGCVRQNFYQFCWGDMSPYAE